MTKNYFIGLAEYNVWANHTVTGWLQQIGPDQWRQPLVSSFPSVEATVVHIAGAEKVWLERFQLVESPVWLPSVFKGSKEEITGIWQKASADLLSFMRSFDESRMTEEISFKRLNGDMNTMPYFEILAHTFNHSTFHRGQLVTLLREVGFTGVSTTDLLAFYRRNK